MKSKTTPVKFYFIFILSITLLFGASANAQVTYCSPTFSSGCSLWNNQTITLDSINWTIGSTDCLVSDYTNMRTTLVKGVAMPMTVISGNYTGCGVWIDFNADGAFDSTENMFHQYLAPGVATYSFNVTAPLTAPVGTFRIRVVAGWGSDCYSVSANGYGACGAYQYGNFDDFTVRVKAASGAGVAELTNSDIISINAMPNPMDNYFIVNVNGKRADNALLTLTDITGKKVLTKQVTTDREALDVTSLTKGLYYLTYTDAKQKKVIKVKK